MAASCSSDDDGNQDNNPTFDPVTIDLSNIPIGLDDTAFEVQGYSFEAFRVEPNPSEVYPGLLLAYPQDGNASYIELDLSQASGVSSITARIFINSQTPITFYNGEQVVDEIFAVNDTEDIFEDNSYQLNGQTITSVRISSYEAIVESITLE
ncbi:hypothetical protein [Winogradskyella sp. SYSU M77433]|uniref:hypothetical protein n=1 Tax=Winogradskyella sp. SYSU M77433 TaxID=3042722 RepID=UPI00247FB1F5|nr:hypothetical protein [Winogradskyella sp. SYSU M77433]MDH7913454.1 hypothetical protein [Winogradskyella sp. SYSU M77433]